MRARLEGWATQYPGLCRTVEIGFSVQGRSLLALRVCGQPSALGRLPQVKLIGGIHGNEPVSTDLLMRLLRHLLEGYGQDPGITAVVDATDLWVLPLMNPDGYEATGGRTRENASGVDLNRDFPSVADPVNTGVGRAPETAAVMAWAGEQRFALCASMHSGALCVVYPWGHAHDPDDPAQQNPETELFLFEALTYAAQNTPMWQRDDRYWFHGTRNAADWYVVLGEMGDWNYRWHGCVELTVEVSTIKAPSYPGFAVEDWTLWLDNRDALLALVGSVHAGVQGELVDGAGQGVDAVVGLGVRGRGAFAARDVRAEIHLELAPGWNAVALPLVPDDPAVANLFPGAIGGAWRWGGDAYVPTATLTAWDGVWVYTPDALRCTVRGTLAGDLPRDVGLGWSCTGFDGRAWTAADPALEAFVWDTGVQGWRSVDPGTGEVNPGQGCWVHSASGTVLEPVPDANPPMNTATLPATGFFHRVLRPGLHHLWFDPSTDPRLEHDPSTDVVSTGTGTAVAVTCGLAAIPLQVFGIGTEDGLGVDGLPLTARLAPVLESRQGECELLWQVQGEGDADDWNRLSAPVSRPGPLSFDLTSWQPGLTYRYWFRLTESGLVVAGSGSAATPYVHTVPATRGVAVAVADSAPVTGRGASALLPAHTSPRYWSGAVLDRGLSRAPCPRVP
jgi:hypothetical protein